MRNDKLRAVLEDLGFIVTFRKEGSPVFSKLARAQMDGAEFMTELEKQYGKQITTRTWNTILKIVAKMRRER